MSDELNNMENEMMDGGESKNTPDAFSNPENIDSNAPVTGAVADFEEFDESTARGPSSMDKLDFLQDLYLNLYIELGRTKMKIKDILELERGYVIELDKMASEPVDIFVNNKKIAEGEVVVIDKHFGIRITNLDNSQDILNGIEK